MNKIKAIFNSIIILLFYFITSSFIKKFDLIDINNDYQKVLFSAFSQVFLFLIPTLYIIYSQSQEEMIDNKPNYDYSNYSNNSNYSNSFTIKDKFNNTILINFNIMSLFYILIGIILVFLVQFTNYLTLEFAEKILPTNYYNTLFEIDSISKLKVKNMILNSNKYFVIFTFAFLPAFIEETFFRGYFLNNLNKHFGFLPSSIIVSLFFALSHFNPIFIIQYFLISMILNNVYNKSGSLIIVIIIHFINNFVGLINIYK